MDYQAELKRLQENESSAKISDFWKPEAKQYRVKAVSELEEGKPYEEEGKEPQLRQWLKIQVEGIEYTWSMPKGTTPASTYGQLVKLASVKGKLKGEEFTVVVTGSGKNKRFTIVI